MASTPSALPYRPHRAGAVCACVPARHGDLLRRRERLQTLRGPRAGRGARDRGGDLVARDSVARRGRDLADRDRSDPAQLPAVPARPDPGHRYGPPDPCPGVRSGRVAAAYGGTRRSIRPAGVPHRRRGGPPTSPPAGAGSWARRGDPGTTRMGSFLRAHGSPDRLHPPHTAGAGRWRRRSDPDLHGCCGPRCRGSVDRRDRGQHLRPHYGAVAPVQWQLRAHRERGSRRAPHAGRTAHDERGDHPARTGAGCSDGRATAVASLGMVPDASGRRRAPSTRRARARPRAVS